MSFTISNKITQHSGKLLGIGNPLLDICAEVEQDLLDKYEVQLDNQILAEDKHQPLYKELIDNYKVQYIAGGATQNSCRVAQWMLTAKGKPGMVGYMGCVGQDDVYGKQLEECCKVDGVATSYMKDPSGAPTGTCAALIKGGERALIANLAAANNFKPSHLEDAKSQELISSAEIYYSAGFFITASAESLLKMAEDYNKAGKTVCLNLSAPFICEFFAEPLAKALAFADYVFGNENEAAAYAKKNGLPEDDIHAIALAIASLESKGPKPRTCIITQGSDSTVVACDGKVTEYAVEKLAKEDLVDTNGAGDAFVGGFLAQLVLGESVEAAVKAGHWAARYMIQTSGTTLNGPCEYKA